MESLGDATREALTLLLSGDATIWGIIGISFRVSTIAILCAIPPAIITAFLLAHFRFPGRKVLITIFSALLSVPAVVVGLTLFIILSRHGPMGDLRLLFTQTAMVMGQILLSFPVLVSMSLAAIQAVDERAWDTARTRCPDSCAPIELEDSIEIVERFADGVCRNDFAYFSTRVFFQCGP